MLGSVGQDLKLKIWQEDESQALNSGRRFRNIFTQSAAHRVSYVSLDFKNIRYETFLALVTRDGLLSLLEPVKSDFFDDWREIDQFWVCGDRITRGVETSFKVSFQQSERPNYNAIAAGLDEKALSLAVAAMDVVKLYRLVKPEDGTYHFLPPVAELTGVPGLVRDVAWSPAAWTVHDLIAITGNDGYLRIYEVSTPYQVKDDDHVVIPEATASSPTHSTAPSPAYPRQPSGISVGLANSSRALSNFRPDTSSSQVQHEWKLVAEMRQEGVWKVEFIRGGKHLIIQYRYSPVEANSNCRKYARLDRRPRKSPPVETRAQRDVERVCELWSRGFRLGLRRSLIGDAPSTNFAELVLRRIHFPLMPENMLVNTVYGCKRIKISNSLLRLQNQLEFVYTGVL